MQVNVENFEQEVLKSELPVVVKFWAPWCGPCKMVAPILDLVKKDFDGRAKFVELNTDDHPTLATQYNVSGIPNFMVFKNGEPKANVVGKLTKSELKLFLEDNI